MSPNENKNEGEESLWHQFSSYQGSFFTHLTFTARRKPEGAQVTYTTHWLDYQKQPSCSPQSVFDLNVALVKWLWKLSSETFSTHLYYYTKIRKQWQQHWKWLKYCNSSTNSCDTKYALNLELRFSYVLCVCVCVCVCMCVCPCQFGQLYFISHG